MCYIFELCKRCFKMASLSVTSKTPLDSNVLLNFQALSLCGVTEHKLYSQPSGNWGASNISLSPHVFYLAQDPQHVATLLWRRATAWVKPDIHKLRIFCPRTNFGAFLHKCISTPRTLHDLSTDKNALKMKFSKAWASMVYVIILSLFLTKIMYDA